MKKSKIFRKLQHMLKADLIPLADTLTPGLTQYHLEQALVNSVAFAVGQLVWTVSTGMNKCEVWTYKWMNNKVWKLYDLQAKQLLWHLSELFQNAK